MFVNGSSSILPFVSTSLLSSKFRLRLKQELRYVFFWSIEIFKDVVDDFVFL